MRYRTNQIIPGVAFNIEANGRTVACDFNGLPFPNFKITDIQIRFFRCTNKYVASLDYTTNDKTVVGHVFKDEYDNVFYNQYPYAVDPKVNKYANYLIKRDVYEDGKFVCSEVFIDMFVYLKSIRRSIAVFKYNRKRRAHTFTTYTKKVMTHRINTYRTILNAYRCYKAAEEIDTVIEEAIV